MTMMEITIEIPTPPGYLRTATVVENFGIALKTHRWWAVSIEAPTHRNATHGYRL
jgi:hypothetical protein